MMDHIKDILDRDKQWLLASGVGAAVVIGGAVAYKYFSKSRKKEWPRDTVILHSIPKGEWDLSLTPFAVKLEAYFRLSGIPYINNETYDGSSKQKVPWIEYNGEEIADSAFIIEYLNKKLAVDTNFHLSVEDKAVGRAFTKMVEENTYWTMVISRWYFDIYDVKPTGLGVVPRFMFFWLRRKIKKAGWWQGLGRHSREELYHIMEQDIKAVADFLGKKKYLFGDMPSEADCAVFGQLAQFCWHMPNLYGEKLIHEKYPNVRDYCYRMKKAYWPDLGVDARSKLQKNKQ